MERVWRRVQSAGRRDGNASSIASSDGNKPKPAGPLQQQQHVAKEQQRPRKRSSRSPQTIVCDCQVQPCPVHPVLIRVRRSQRPPPPNCDCPPEQQPCPHAAKPAGPRRVRRCDCAEHPCRHVATSTRRRPQGLSSLFATNSASATVVLSASTGNAGRPHCPHGDDEVCDCQSDARPCLHTVKSSRARRGCDCPGQPCPHRALEGRIKRVKCRVRRAGCAMARCTAELAMLHLHWELASECTPCRPRALTRRLCKRQQSDNELYRSNSFKFERFERSKDECPTPMRKQINNESSCDKKF